MATRDLRSMLIAERVKQELKARRQRDRYIPQAATERQAAFLKRTEKEVFYGGAAGGGKSSALLMAALQYVHVPNYSALIIRRTLRDLDLPDSIMSRAKQWLAGTDAQWNNVRHVVTFPKSGATLAFGYLDSASDQYGYQGAAFQGVFFDEVTQFPEQWYRYLFSRLRKLSGSPVPLRVWSAGNPGGIGHEWVKRRFVDYEGKERAFVPATLADNPHLDASYRESLAVLDENTRRQLEDGIWIRDAAGLVYPFNDDDIIDAAPKCTYHLLAMDYGFTDATSFTVYGWRDNDPHVYVLESYKLQGTTPSIAAEQAHKLNAAYQFTQMVGDAGGLGKGYIEEAKSRFNLPIEPADKTNKRGYISLMVGEMERHRIKVVRGKCDDLLKEWAELPWSADRQKECEGFDNHCADGALYGWRATQAHHNREPESPPDDAQRMRDEERAMLARAEERARNKYDPYGTLL